MGHASLRSGRTVPATARSPGSSPPLPCRLTRAAWDAGPAGVLALAVSLALAGCRGGGGDAPVVETSVRDSAGVEIVDNAGPGTLEPLGLRETLRLGRVEGAGPELFSEVYALALGGDGRIYVGDNASGTVRVFGPDGSFLHEMGGRGGGPAEVTMVNDLFVVGDTVGLVDWQRGGKLVLFRSDGSYLANRTFRRPDGSHVMPVRPGPAGWLASVMDPYRPSPLAEGEERSRSSRIHMLDFETGEPGEVLYTVPLAPMYGMQGAEGGTAPSLFPPMASWGFDAAGRFYLMDGTAYRVNVYDPAGSRVRSVRRAYEPRPLDEEDVRVLREEALAKVDSASGGRPGARERLARRLDGQAGLPMPATVPPLARILVSRDGSFWAERRDAHDPGLHAASLMFGPFGRVPWEETVWDLFGPDGRFRGTVALPPRFRAYAVEGLQVVGVLLDALDVEHVVRLEATPTGG